MQVSSNSLLYSPNPNSKTNSRSEKDVQTAQLTTPGPRRRRRALRSRSRPPSRKSRHQNRSPRRSLYARRPSPSSALRAIRNPSPESRGRARRRAARWVDPQEHDVATPRRDGHHEHLGRSAALVAGCSDGVAVEYARHGAVEALCGERECDGVVG
jgi:hypothetical protein